MIQAFETYHFKHRQKKTKTFSLFLLKTALFSLLLYLLLNAFFISSFFVGSESMNPGIKAGERLFILPIAYRIRLPFFQRSIGGIQKPARGDIVVIISPQYPRLSFLQSIADPLVRFFSLQKVSLIRDSRGRKAAKYMLKRVVGVPGDTVKLDGFEAFLKIGSSSTFLGEKDVISVPYSINTRLFVEGWSSDLPFSGNREEVKLGENEYFLLGDNRPYSSDSRSWGAVSVESFVGKVFLRYWPFKKFGKP